MRRSIHIISYAVILSVMIATGIGARSFYSDTPLRTRDIAFERARVLRVVSENLKEDPTLPGLFIGHQILEIEVLSGEFQDNVYSIRNPMGRTYNIHTREDMKIIVSVFTDREDSESILVYNYKRNTVTWWLLGLFILTVIGVGRVKGMKSLFSLTFTGVMIICYLVPAILKGTSPILAAIITVTAAVTAGFFILNGWSKKTAAAIAGTVAGVVIAGIISLVAGQMANLSGMTMENSEQLMYVADATGLQLRGLMFTAILIASLGAMMDVGMSIASSVAEVNRVNTKLSRRELFMAGMNVGRDIIGTMTNTLILVFAGGLLTLILLITAYGLTYNQVSNIDLLSIEVIQALAGSIGIVLTVPITAACAAFFMDDRKVDAKSNTRRGK